MIINDLYIHKIISLDRKTDTILTIYPNAELTSPLATQSFQMIRRRYTQIIKTCGIIHHNKLSECYSFNILRKLRKKSGYIFFLFLYQRNSLSYPHYTRSSYTCQSGIKRAGFKPARKKSGIKEECPGGNPPGQLL